jgi:hypothetical protein
MRWAAASVHLIKEVDRMHRILTASALLLPLFFAPTVFAQASLGFDIGYNNGIHSHLEDRDWVVDSEVKPVLSVSLFNGHFGEEGRNLRYGLRYTHQLVRTIPQEGPGYAHKWRSSIFQLETERLITEGSFGQVVVGAGVGFVSRSNSNENEGWNSCDTAFCNFPDFNWVFSPKARVLVPVIEGLALSTEIRANFHLSEASETYPYKTGLAFLVGFEWRVGPGPGDPYRAPVHEPVDTPVR